MRNKIYVTAISILFVGVMIWCPILSNLSAQGIIELPENKSIKLPEKIYEEGTLFASTFNAIEETKANISNTYTNCLPFYDGVTTFMMDNERFMRETLLDTLYKIETSFVITADNPILTTQAPIGDGENDEKNNVAQTTVAENTATETTVAANTPEVVQVSEEEDGAYKAKRIGTEDNDVVWAFAEADKPYSEGWADRTLFADEEKLRRYMEEQLWHINRIANSNADVNFFVYVCTRFQDTEIFADIIKDIRIMNNQVSTKPLMDSFLAGLDMNGVEAYDYFKIDTLEKRLENLFRTDHHQSAQGAYNIYSDVINMMSAYAPEIGTPLPLNGLHIFEDIELRGSHVWGSRYSEIHDVFSDFLVDLPPHYMYSELDGGENVARRFVDYTRGYYKKDTFADHYANYYPRPARIEYYENNTERNLLILGDSYTWAAGELIGANFDNTYITIWTHGEFDYPAFIEEKNITDVLVMQISDRLMFNISRNAQISRVITE